MIKQVITTTLIAFATAMVNAATIVTDFSTTNSGSGSGTVDSVGATVDVSGGDSILSYKADSLNATGMGLRYGTGELGNAIALESMPWGWSGELQLTYSVGASDANISPITLSSGFFDQDGNFVSGAECSVVYVLTFTSNDEVLSIWTGAQSYSESLMYSTALTGDAFDVSANSEVTLTIHAGQASGAFALNTFFGLNSITMNAVQAVPEPSMFGLLAGLGALALTISRRRRK